MLVVLIKLLRLKERAILSNKGKKATLSVASICIIYVLHGSYIYNSIMFVFTSSSLTGSSVSNTSRDACILSKKLSKSVCNGNKFLDFVQCTCTNDVFTPIFDWTVNAICSSCSRWVLLILPAGRSRSVIRPTTGDTFI